MEEHCQRTYYIGARTSIHWPYLLRSNSGGKIFMACLPEVKS